jgi:tetratricopeptide (TPR) repeat protein
MAGDHAAAQEAFREVLSLDPKNESAQGYLSYIATIRREGARSRQRTPAIAPSGRFASDVEIRAEGFYQNALAAERSGDRYAAIRHDLRALRANPGHTEARAHLEKLRRDLSDGVEPLIDAGRKAFREEDLQTALDLWRRAVLVDPENERARAYVTRAERQLQNLERMRAEPDVAEGGR